MAILNFCLSGLNVAFWVAFPDGRFSWLSAAVAVVCFGTGIHSSIKESK